MLNVCHFIGRAGRDPEIRMSTAGKTYGRFAIATNRRIKDESGQYINKTTWIPLTCFTHDANYADKWIRKGDMVYAECRVEMSMYTTKTGENVHKTEFIVNKLTKITRSDIGNTIPIDNAPTIEANNDPEPAADQYADDIPF